MIYKRVSVYLRLSHTSYTSSQQSSRASQRRSQWHELSAEFPSLFLSSWSQIFFFSHNYLKNQNSGFFFLKNKVLSLLSYYQKVDKPLNINRIYKIQNYILHIKISEVRHLFQRTGHKILGEDFINNWLLNKIYF